MQHTDFRAPHCCVGALHAAGHDVILAALRPIFRMGLNLGFRTGLGYRVR